MPVIDKQLDADYEQASGELLQLIKSNGDPLDDFSVPIIEANLTLANVAAKKLGVEMPEIHLQMVYLSWLHNRVRLIREERAARLINLN